MVIPAVLTAAEATVHLSDPAVVQITIVQARPINPGPPATANTTNLVQAIDPAPATARPARVVTTPKKDPVADRRLLQDIRHAQILRALTAHALHHHV